MTFMRSNKRATLRKLFSLPSTHSWPDKISIRLWNKNFLTEIYKCYMQMFYLTTYRNTFAGKFVKSENFLVVLREHIIFNELRFVKWVRFFQPNCTVKWVIIFASFCWLWDFLLENLKSKKNSDYVRWNVWTNIKKLYSQNNIFRKIIPIMRFWISFILVQISFFGGLL